MSWLAFASLLFCKLNINRSLSQEISLNHHATYHQKLCAIERLRHKRKFLLNPAQNSTFTKFEYSFQNHDNKHQIEKTWTFSIIINICWCCTINVCTNKICNSVLKQNNRTGNDPVLVHCCRTRYLHSSYHSGINYSSQRRISN